jgi:hypothetical protein
MSLAEMTAPGEKPRARTGTPARLRWFPTRWSGEYRLPPSIHKRLQDELSTYRNRDAAHRLAVFLGRFHATPKRVGKAFAIDRRALNDHKALSLSEAQVRGAIKALLEIGFLRVESNPGHVLGRQHKLPTQYQFNGEFLDRFTFLVRKASSPKYRDSLSEFKNQKPEGLHLGEKGIKSQKWVPSRKVIVSPPAPVLGNRDPKDDDPGLAGALAKLAAAFSMAKDARQ